MVQHPSASFLTRLRPHLLVALYCVIATFIVKPIAGYIDLANVVILFLLLVFLVARKYGRGPALTASFLAVGLFDFFFVPPHLSFAVDDIQYLITFLVMLTVAIITGQLVARLGQQAIEATERERRNHALYKMASRLAGAMTLNQVEEIAHGFLWGGKSCQRQPAGTR
jgi:two-component system, OmpR family, sensor histidine kinase KdpD